MSSGRMPWDLRDIKRFYFVRPVTSFVAAANHLHYSMVAVRLSK